jgi:hypothetical protein
VTAREILIARFRAAGVPDEAAENSADPTLLELAVNGFLDLTRPDLREVAVAVGHIPTAVKQRTKRRRS